MPRKNNVVYYEIADNVAISADYTSGPFSMQYLDRACLKLSFVGTIVGTPSIQVSNDYGPSNAKDNTVTPTWDDIPLGMVALTGTDQDYVIDIQMTGMQWLRIFVDHTSGAGTLTASVTGKES